jgi:hypothetical protein
VTSARFAVAVLLAAGCSGGPPGPPEPKEPARIVLRGRVTFRGTPPKPRVIRGHPEGDRLRDDLVLDADGHVRWAFVYVKKGLEGKVFPPSTVPVLLNQKSYMYDPHVQGAQVGQPVMVYNRDPVLHSVHPLTFDNPEYGLGQSDPERPTVLRFSRPEVPIALRCDVHPWMRAFVGILEHPFFAVSDATGNFEIGNLPAGKYRIGVWHERLKFEDQDLDVREDCTVDFVGVLK